MSRFRFSLERVLEIRDSQEKSAAAALAAASGRLAEAESTVDRLLEGIQSTRQRRFDGAMDPALAGAMESSMATAARAAVRDRDLKRGEIERLRGEWQEARRLKDLVEKLRVRQFEEHRRAEQRKAETALDEWAVQHRDPL